MNLKSEKRENESQKLQFRKCPLEGDFKYESIVIGLNVKKSKFPPEKNVFTIW